MWFKCLSSDCRLVLLLSLSLIKLSRKFEAKKENKKVCFCNKRDSRFPTHENCYSQTEKLICMTNESEFLKSNRHF